MATALIPADCKRKGDAATRVYHCALWEHGLSGVLYGKGSPSQKKKAHRIWLAAVRCCGTAFQRKIARQRR